MNKILLKADHEMVLKEDKIFKIVDNCKMVFLIKNNLKIQFDVEEAIKCDIHIYSVDKSVDVVVNMNKEKAVCNLSYSNINYSNNNYRIDVFHNVKETEVNLFNRGVNVKDNELAYNVVSKVPKKISQCLTNQENSIINIKDGKSTINPVLLIDNYDVSSSHSAYIGKFSDDVLFYMGTRGIDLKKAYELLLKGFLLHDDGDIVSDFKSELSKV